MLQARYWILTIPYADFTPYPPPGVAYIGGQLERGSGGYLHWQVIVCFDRKVRLGGVKSLFGDTAHCEISRSSAAKEYCLKEESRVEGTGFELGTWPFSRNNGTDWDRVRSLAQSGRLSPIPADVYVRCYNSLRRITGDYIQATAMERHVVCYWGRSGYGKSRRAWSEASFAAYPKNPRTKFWDGYRGEECVVLDEFRGGIDIGNVLRWFDRYPCLVEVKGSAVALRATKIWITSNLHPRDWYPDLDSATLEALLRRLTIVEFTLPWSPSQ